MAPSISSWLRVCQPISLLGLLVGFTMCDMVPKKKQQKRGLPSDSTNYIQLWFTILQFTIQKHHWLLWFTTNYGYHPIMVYYSMNLHSILQHSYRETVKPKQHKIAAREAAHIGWMLLSTVVATGCFTVHCGKIYQFFSTVDDDLLVTSVGSFPSVVQSTYLTHGNLLANYHLYH